MNNDLLNLSNFQGRQNNNIKNFHIAWSTLNNFFNSSVTSNIL